MMDQPTCITANDDSTLQISQDNINNITPRITSELPPVTNSNPEIATTALLQQLSPCSINDNTIAASSTSLSLQGSINNIATITTSELPPITNSNTEIATTATQLSPCCIDDITIAANTTTLSLQPNSSNEISDDEVQILSIVKKEPVSRMSIKIESSDEEASKGVSLAPKSETGSCRDGSDNMKQPFHSKDTVVGSSSPKDSTCSICLGEFDNKAFLDQCFHAFCFYCILQWSEVVRTCPLCKAEFTQIIHSVKSMTEYQQHKLPPKENPTKNTSTSDRRFRYRTTLVDGRSVTSRNTSQPFNAWEQRAERRERILAMKRRRSIRAKEKRQSVYARNLWVQMVKQTGRAKYRDTSPKFFHANPACTHRLVPWLTRELQCLLNDEQSHVDFVLQLILTLITKVPIDSREFIEQVSPFLSEKTEHFCHEFMSYAQSPFDMKTYDERAQYDWTGHNNQQPEQTPVVIDMSATGWDSPDETQTSASVPYSIEPGPSGISTHVLNVCSPPLTDSIQLPTADVLDQVTNDVIELSPEVIDVEIPRQKYRHKHKRKHKHRHKHKHRKRSCDYGNIEPGPSQLSTSPPLGSTSRVGRVDVVVLSSSHDSSPEAALNSCKKSSSERFDDDNKRILHVSRKGKNPKQNLHSSSETLKSRDSSSDHSYDDKHLKVGYKGKHSKKRYSRSREKSSSETLKSRDSSSDHSYDDKHLKVGYKGKHSKKRYSRSREKSSSETLKSRDSSSDCLNGKHSKRRYSRSREKSLELSRDSPRRHSRKHREKSTKRCRSLSPISNGFSNSVPIPSASSHTVARPCSPTEEEMRQEILDLERKIAEDTRRLDELIKKQKQRKLVACAAGASSLQTEDSETDGQSR